MHLQNITAIRHKYGSKLAILAHHYQSDSIVEHASMVGDSLQLAAAISELEAKYIVFCGVDFMAETAAVLAGPEQMVFNPRPDATCVMADMAPALLVETVLKKLNQKKKVVPLAYVNSSVGVKALCGQYGGSVCTSSNAAKMLKWAFEQGDQVLFLPDKNLGRNMAALSGIEPAEIATLDIRKNGRNINPAALNDKKLLLWPGVCAVHFRLKPDMVSQIMKDNPRALVVVHPESHPDVVALAHEAGSTSRIIAFVKEAEPGSMIFIGTEDNLVHRLKKMHPDRTILPLGAGYCSNMAKTNPDNLLKCLNSLNSENAVKIEQGLIESARISVRTMLKVSAS